MIVESSCESRYWNHRPGSNFVLASTLRRFDEVMTLEDNRAGLKVGEYAPPRPSDVRSPCPAIVSANLLLQRRSLATYICVYTVQKTARC